MTKWRSSHIDVRIAAFASHYSILPATDEAPELVVFIQNSAIVPRNLNLESHCSCLLLAIVNYSRSQKKIGMMLHSNFCCLADCNKDLWQLKCTHTTKTAVG